MPNNAMTVILLVATLVVVAAAARLRWRRRTSTLVARLHRVPGPAGPSFSASDLDGLPCPVKRYFQAVLREGQPRVRGARVSQTGDFLVDPAGPSWRPFAATQHFATRPAGFVWDARIGAAPGVGILVRDAFVDGAGSMEASFMALHRLMLVKGTPDVAAGALHRYLAEAVLFPTALLPAEGVAWAAVDESTARATLTAGSVTVSLDFRFGPHGLVASVFTPARSRDVGGRGVPTPWQGRWWAYEERGAMRVPTQAEVEWILPEGPQGYWRGRLADVAYDTERP